MSRMRLRLGESSMGTRPLKTAVPQIQRRSSKRLHASSGTGPWSSIIMQEFICAHFATLRSLKPLWPMSATSFPNMSRPSQGMPSTAGMRSNMYGKSAHGTSTRRADVARPCGSRSAVDEGSAAADPGASQGRAALAGGLGSPAAAAAPGTGGRGSAGDETCTW